MSTPARGLGYRHPRVQHLRRLLGRRSAREKEGCFVAEGMNLLEEALRSGAKLDAVFLGASWRSAGEHLAGLVERSEGAGARIFELGPGVLERVAGTVTPQPVLAVSEIPHRTLAEVGAAAPNMVVVCAGVRDPGNAGALARSAWAAGADAVVVCEDSVDFWNPKAVRSSAGAVFHLPIVPGQGAARVLEELGRWGLVRLGTAAQGGQDYATVDLARPFALVVGNEASGLPLERLGGQLDTLVTVPMPGGAESLNVGAATAVLCFEAVRQRRAESRPKPGTGKLATQ